MARKSLTGEIKKGVDLMFSANDAQEAYEVKQAAEPHKAQDVDPAELATAIKDMSAAIDADAERKRAAAEARKTQGRKGYAMPRLNISLTPTGYEYVQTMARINGKSVTRFISDLVDKDMERNADRYRKARELLADE